MHVLEHYSYFIQDLEELLNLIYRLDIEVTKNIAQKDGGLMIRSRVYFIYYLSLLYI